MAATSARVLGAPDLMSFTWYRPTGGFRWVKRRGVLLLTDSPEGSRPYGQETLDPTAHNSALFQEFADLPPTRDAILSFANQSGQLGLTADLNPNRTTGRAHAYERFDDWTREVIALRRPVGVWRQLVDNDLAPLRKRFLWSRRRGSRYAHYYDAAEPGTQFGDAPYLFDERVGYREDLANRADSEGFPAIARMFIQVILDLRIKSTTHVRMLLEEGEPVLRIEPRHLLGALWLQFARALDGNRLFRVCLECGGWFEVHPGVNRSNRKYDSDACRQKAHRRREKQRVHK